MVAIDVRKVSVVPAPKVPEFLITLSEEEARHLIAQLGVLGGGSEGTANCYPLFSKLAFEWRTATGRSQKDHAATLEGITVTFMHKE